MCGKDNNPSLDHVDRWNYDISGGPIEIDSVSSPESVSRAVAEQLFTERLRKSDGSMPDVEKSNTPADSPQHPHSGTPDRWSSTVEVSSTLSREKCCSSRSSQNTLPVSPGSMSSRSEVFEEHSEKGFQASSALRRGGSLKSRLLQRAGISADSWPQNFPGSGDLLAAGKQPTAGMYDTVSSKQCIEVLRESLPIVSKTLEEESICGQHNTNLSPQGGKDLHGSSSSQHVSSRFSFLPSNPPVYPTLYRPGLSYHEAAATAALFYNQLAAVHHLHHRQRAFLGARNQLTMSSEGHAHTTPSDDTPTSVQLLRND